MIFPWVAKEVKFTLFVFTIASNMLYLHCCSFRKSLLSHQVEVYQCNFYNSINFDIQGCSIQVLWKIDSDATLCVNYKTF